MGRRLTHACTDNVLTSDRTVCAGRSRAIVAYGQPPCRPRVSRVAFVTAAFGLYERALHDPIVQEMIEPPPSFVAFCDTIFAAQVLRTTEEALRGRTRSKLADSVWELDWSGYHRQLAPREFMVVNGSCSNFQMAKWYKMQFYLVPRLRLFDWVVWMDATIALRDPLCSHFIASGTHSLISVHYAPRRCSLHAEMVATAESARYKEVRDAGFSRVHDYTRAGQPDLFGMWLTCFNVHNMKHNATVPALNLWHRETRIYMNDQLAFPHVAWQFRDVLRVGSLLERQDKRRSSSNPSCYGGFPCSFLKLKHGMNASLEG